MTRDWERLGAICGVLFFVAVLITFFTPGTPDSDDPTARIIRDIADDRDGILIGAYITGLGALLFAVFVGGLWARLRRAELEFGPAVLVLLGGTVSVVLVLMETAVLNALVAAVDDHRSPAVVRSLFELEGSVILPLAFSSAVFYVGAALSASQTGSLPAWLRWWGLAIAAAFVIGMLGTLSENPDDSVLGWFWFIALVLNFFWVLAASVVMLRSRPVAPEGAVVSR